MTQRELTPADYIRAFRRRWLLILIPTILGGPLLYVISMTLPSSYKSQTLVLVEQPTVPTELVRSVITTEIGQRLSSMQQQILSRARLEPIIHQFGLYPADVNRLSIEDLVLKLQKSIEITPVLPMAETRAQQLPGFYISVTLDNPRTAQAVCTTITSMFIEENLLLRQRHSEDTTQFLAQQLGDAKGKLDEQDAKLAAFKSRYMGSLPDDEPTNLNLLSGLTSQLDVATQAISRAQQDKSFAESMLNQQLAAWQASRTRENPETLQKQRTELEMQLARLRGKYTDDYPDVIKGKNDIAELDKKIAESETNNETSEASKSTKAMVEPLEIQRLRVQIHSFEQLIAEKTSEQEQIQQQIKTYRKRIQSSPAVEQQYKELTRGYQTALESYNELQKKRDQSAMATDLERRQEGEQFRVLDPANLPDRPSFPNRPLFALGGFGGGLALGMALALLLEMRDTSLRSEKDVELALRLPVLAVLPMIEGLAASESKKPVGPPGFGAGISKHAGV